MKANYKIIKISDYEEFTEEAAAWFHRKWGIPQEAYAESMAECLRFQSAVPQWYLVTDNERIIAGAGVIENDYHERRDLTPNVCAVYVEEQYRCRGIAGELLQYICDDCRSKGIDQLYLVTDHTFFMRDTVGNSYVWSREKANRNRQGCMYINECACLSDGIS